MGSLLSKMKLKSGSRAAIINAPEGYWEEIRPMPAGVRVEDKLQGEFDWIQVFVKTKADLGKLIPRVLPSLKPESILWISFPKGSSKEQTDLTRDKGWEAVKTAELKWINLISINESWSAFSMRPFRPGEEKKSFR